MIVGEEHYQVAQTVQQVLQRYQELRDIIAILTWTSYPKKTSNWSAALVRSRSSFRSFLRCGTIYRVTPVSSSAVKIRFVVSRAILDGEHDDLPEDAFYMVGSIEDAIEKLRRFNLKTRPARQEEFYGNNALRNRECGTICFLAPSPCCARGTIGEIGVMPGHAPLLTGIHPGAVTLRMEDGTEEVFFWHLGA